MLSLENGPATPMIAPTSPALGPLRAQQTISSVFPTLNPMVKAEALANACTRWAISVSSSNADRSLSLPTVSQACVAMIALPQSDPEALPGYLSYFFLKMHGLFST